LLVGCRESGGEVAKRLDLRPLSSAWDWTVFGPAGWLFKGFVKLLEKRLLNDEGILLERPAKLVGGEVLKEALEGAALVEGETIGFKNGLLGLTAEDPPKAIGEVARPKDVDMERCRGIEIDNGAAPGPADWSAPTLEDEESMPTPNTLEREEVDLDRWCDMFGMEERRRWVNVMLRRKK